jgi:hypothetical protein
MRPARSPDCAAGCELGPRSRELTGKNDDHRKQADGSPAEPNECELNSIRHDPDRLVEIRSRLSDISWWMRVLCQRIAIRANHDDGESGKFWQGRCSGDWLAPLELDEAGAPGPQPSVLPTRASDKGFLPMGVEDYLELLDWTGRQTVAGKTGTIPAHLAPDDSPGLSVPCCCPET